MPTIIVPGNVTVEVDGAKHDFAFVDGFMMKTILRDRQWGVNTEWLIAAMEIRTLFKFASPESEVPLSADQYNKLLQVVKAPTDPYNPTVMIECGTFIDAVLKAK